MSNTNLHKAKKAKNDEFYTRYEDIEAELSHYPVENFKDKVIYCPCDMPSSNFVKYFENNKDRLVYKKLIHTSIQEGYDFRSKECEKYFEEADIVVTNPPFSLFRDIVSLLEKYNLKYALVGNMNAIGYKDIFPLIKQNRLFLGYNYVKVFNKPDGTTQQFGNILWYTNMDLSKHHEELLLVKQYNETDYPKYDNYDAIDVSKTKAIPYDYEGVMGVPITFLDKYNPEQFEILGLLQSSTDEQAGTPNLRYYNDFKEMRQDMTYTGASGGKANGNPVLKGKSEKGNFLYNTITNEYVHSVYSRIVIRRK